MMDTALRNVILAHAQECYPRECCGLLVNVDGTPEYRPCRNLAEGTDHFILSAQDFGMADRDGEIIAVVHSHPNARPTPSQADLVSCEASGYPWYIVSWPGAEWAYIEPKGYVAPLIGRQWAHGVLDCYSIIKDWYAQERGIVIPDFARSDNWWSKGQNLYVENFAKAGFRRVLDETPQAGDVLLMQIMAPVPNHAAILLPDGKILHHLHNRLSSRDIWGGYYRTRTTHILRYDQTKNNSVG